MTKMYMLGEVKAADGDSKNGAFEVILSAPTLDRDGEILDAKIFEPLPDHVTFDIDHGMSVATTVGSGVPSYDDQGRLIVKGTYSSIPRAQEVRTLVKEGHIRTTSVAFMNPVREEKDGVQHVVKAELLNGAFVPIPSNRESVVLTAKSYAEATSRAGARPAPRQAPARKGHGMTANDLRETVSTAVRNAHGADDRWVWLRDYTDEWAVFIVEDENATALYQQNYSVTERVASLTGEPTEVKQRTVYEPVTQSSTTATSAPATAAASAAKSPASAVARARIAAARASLPVL